MKFEVLPLLQRNLWIKLALMPIMSRFYLAGGTAIALHLEHRESIDFDFFSNSQFNSDQLIIELKSLGLLEISSSEKGTFLGFLDGIKVSFFQYPYQLLEDPVEYNGILISQLSDLSVMKLVAIAQRGTKKDFVDFYELLVEGWTIESIFEYADRKLPDVKINKVHYLKSLIYFADANDDPMPRMLKSRKWSMIKKQIQDEVLKLLP